jgi:two-component system nitrate/nitrite response regulator NarL
MGTAKLYLADSNRIMREGLKKILPRPGFVIVGESDSLVSAVSWFKNSGETVDIIICDPADDAVRELSAIAEIVRDFGQPKVVLLTLRLAESWLTATLQCGVTGFLSKEVEPEALRAALQVIMFGGQVLTAHRQSRKLEQPREPFVAERSSEERAAANEIGRTPPTDMGFSLSAREQQILGCLVEGLANKEIARELSIAEATVKVHLKALLRKLKASNRTQAAMWAVANKPLLEGIKIPEGAVADETMLKVRQAGWNETSPGAHH